MKGFKNVLAYVDGKGVINCDIAVENGVIKITDANGNEVNLNAGKTWIGYASSNHNGVVNIG